MRNPVAVALLAALLAPATGQTVIPPTADPPGQIVIEPKKPAAPTGDPAKPGGVAVLRGTDPNRPGFLVISPNPKAASTLLPAPNATSRVDNKDGIPHVVIVGTNNPRQMPPAGGGAADPVKPPTGAKPPAAEPEKVADGKILVETYDVAYCRGCKVGYMHTLVREYLRDGKKVVYGSKKLTLQVARFGQPVEQWVEESTVEGEDGKVYATQCRQGLGKNQVLSLSGKVTDKGLEVVIEGQVSATEVVKWPDGVLGVAKEATLLKDMRPKPGVAVEYQVYYGQFNTVVTHKLTAKGTVEVADGGGKPRKLLKVVQEMKPVGDFRQPPVIYFVDPDTYEPVKLECDMAAFGGVMTAVRSTREVALAKPTKYLDLGEVQSIYLPAPVPGIHTKEAVTYRVTLGGDVPLDRVFPSDGRQAVTVHDPKARTLDVAVTAVRSPVKPKDPLPAPGKEYTSENYYIDWDNDLVKRHAATAVSGLGKAATDWQKAQTVEAWVHKSIKQVEFSQAMGTCGNTARELTGDCTESAMLAAGMCRALGIPSRTAMGLVYAPTRDGKAMLAYHMWLEVWVESGWVALDPILGMGSVGPGHIKITDAHWDGEKGVTPVLPVLGLLAATPKVEVVK